jgi:hypothetical protein
MPLLVWASLLQKTMLEVSMTNVNLDTNELNILLSALNHLAPNQEVRLEREYGSTASLYNKLYSVAEQLQEVNV